MTWYYASGSSQQGPVDLKELLRLKNEGSITGSTLVWKEGMENWIAFESVPELQSAGYGPAAEGSRLSLSKPAPAISNVESEKAENASAPGAGVVCMNCDKQFALDDVVKIEGRFVCNACKPQVLQRIKEGLPADPMLADPAKLVENILARGVQIRISEWISGGWAVARRHLFLGMLAVFLIQLVSGVVSSIPCIGSVAGIVLNGPLFAGLYWFFILGVRGENPRIADAFAGFNRNFNNLMMQGIVVTLMMVAFFVPGILAFVIGGAFSSDNPSPAAIIPGILLFILGMIPVFFLSICWMYSLPLIIDKLLPWKAALGVSYKVVKSRFGGFFLFGLVIGLIWFAAAIFFGILFAALYFMGGAASGFGEGGEGPGIVMIAGFLIGFPLAAIIFLALASFSMAAMAKAYDDVFGERA